MDVTETNGVGNVDYHTDSADRLSDLGEGPTEAINRMATPWDCPHRFPRTRFVQVGRARRGWGPRHLTFATDCPGSAWHRHKGYVRLHMDLLEKFFAFLEDIGKETTCHAVQDLEVPHCAGDSCLPCFVIHAINAQGGFIDSHLRQVIGYWHTLLRRQSLLAPPAHGARVQLSTPAHTGITSIIANIATGLPAAQMKVLTFLATKGGVRITKAETLQLSRAGVLQAALGAIAPTHRTFRDLVLTSTVETTFTHAPGVLYTVDCGAQVFIQLSIDGMPGYPMATAHEHIRAAADVVKALLGLMQLTLEDHLICVDPVTWPNYIPKHAAAAM